MQRRLRPARSGALAVARRAQQDLDADRRAAVFAPAVVLEPLDLGVERGGQLVARPGCAVALAGYPVAARRGLVAHACCLRSCLRRQIALDALCVRSRRLRSYSALLVGVLDRSSRVVVIGGLLIAIGGDLVAVGGVLVGVRGGLIQIRGGLIAVGRGVIEVGERLGSSPVDRAAPTGADGGTSLMTSCLAARRTTYASLVGWNSDRA